jgi:hypothetical protein
MVFLQIEGNTDPTGNDVPDGVENEVNNRDANVPIGYG